jgi:hypothetical protein
MSGSRGPAQERRCLSTAPRKYVTSSSWDDQRRYRGSDHRERRGRRPLNCGTQYLEAELRTLLERFLLRPEPTDTLTYVEATRACRRAQP